MALLFADGFPYEQTQTGVTTVLSSRYESIDWAESFGNWSPQVQAGGRWTDGRYLKFIYIAYNKYRCGYVLKSFAALTPQTVMVQFGYKCPNASNTVCQIQDVTAGSSQLTLTFEGGLLNVRRGTYNGTILGTSTSAFIPNQWHQIEFKAKIDSSVGTILVKVDGETYIELTDGDQNTQNTANAYANGFLFGQAPSCGWGSEVDYTDIIIMDTTGSYCNDLLGVKRVQICMPTQDSATHAQWNCSTGVVHFALVDEVPPVTTDYNYTSTASNIDGFIVPDVANLLGSIDAVIFDLYCISDEPGTPMIAGHCRSGGVDGVGTEVMPPAAGGYAQSIMYVDPATSAPFTPAGFNAAEFGYKKTA